MNYPEEIYKYPLNGEPIKIDDRAQRVLVEHGYRCGHEVGFGYFNTLVTKGYSNLTLAFDDTSRVDFERLNGRAAMCINQEVGILRGHLHRDEAYPPDDYYGWYSDDAQSAWVECLKDAWSGENGWALYVEGDIPIKPKTAKELESGMCFHGKVRNGGSGDSTDLPRAQVVAVGSPEERSVIAYSSDFLTISRYDVPELIDVVTEFGIGVFEGK